MKPMTRRIFLGRAGSLAAVTALAATMPRFARASPLNLPIGIQLYVVNSDLGKDAEATIKQLAAIGYKEVETAGFGSAKTAAALKKILDDNGIKCPSAHLQFDMNNLNKAFDDAHTLGCTYATSSVPKQLISAPRPDMGNMTPEQRRAAMGTAMRSMLAPITPEEFKQLAEAMNKVGTAAKASGLRFAAHNHTMEFTLDDGKPGYDYLLSHTEKGTVFFEIDCGWITVAGYKPAEFVNRYPGRIKMLHIKDFLPFEKGATTGGANSPKGAEIGQGVVNYKEIFASLKGKQIEHIFVEQEGPYARMPPLEAAAFDYKYLSSLS